MRGHHKENSTEPLVNKDIILDVLRITPGQTVIDVGCGNGYMAKAFSRLTDTSGKVFAIDRSAEVFKNLRNEIHECNIEIIEGDITRGIPLPDRSADVIYLSTVFHIFSGDQRDSCIGEIRRLLKPEGILAIVEIDKKDTPIGPPVPMRVSPGELTQAVGMKVLSLTKVGAFFYMMLFINETEPSYH